MEQFEEKRVIGRVSEMRTIRDFFSSHIAARTGGGLYVCGRSGTGKTEAIRQIYEGLVAFISNGGENKSPSKRETKRSRKPRVAARLAWVNGNSASSSAALFSCLAKELQISPGTKAETAVESRLNASSKHAADSEELIIIVIDEIDLLPEDTVRRLFSWANERSLFALVGIANVVNAGIHLFKTVQFPPVELPFAPYDAAQLKAIAIKKLGDRSERFSPEALDMCARKVSVKTGDVRHCLSLCEEALILAKDKPKVAIVDVVRAGAGQSPIAKTITAFPAQYKFALVACVNAANILAVKADLSTSASSPTSIADNTKDVNGDFGRLDKYVNPVEIKVIKEQWQKLKEIWHIPIEGELADHLQGLCDSKTLESTTASKGVAVKVCAKKKPSGGAQNPLKFFKVLPTREEIFNGLVGGNDGDENESEDNSTKDADIVSRRPIIMAFNGVRQRSYANMHAPLT